MSITLNYALILTACQVVFSLLLFILGFEGEKIAQLQKLQWLSLLYTVPIMWLGIKAVREASPDKSLSYGRGVGTGTLIMLYSGVLSGIYRFIHLKFINPNFAEYQMDFLRRQWAEKGLSDAQIEGAEKFTRAMMGPVFQAVVTPIGSVIFGVILALILAIFLKRAPANEPPVAT